MNRVFTLCLFAVAFANAQVTSSVSGLSSGAFAAVQFQMAYSGELVGAGVVAGGPYYCAQDEVALALTECTVLPEGIVLELLYSYVSSSYSQGLIDNPNNLKNHKVWLWSGTDDTVVYQGVMKALAEFYGNYMSESAITTVFNVPAEHSFPTNNYGNQCSYLGTPYINNCGVDGAGSILNTLYSGLNKATNGTNNIQTLSQSSYAPSGWSVGEMSMAEDAYYYIPSNGCNGTCKVHVVFHGCQQTTADIGMDFVMHTGYNAWAEANGLIILYPQIVKTELFPENPEGCFDWWGYTNENYATNQGPQMQTVYNMMNYLKTL